MRRWADASVIAVAVVAALSAPRPARANGAFPEAENILTPADRPQEILLVTNFGIISSADGGATWLWSCEQDGNALGTFYQLTPLPRNRLLAVANQHVVYSDDRSCSWQIGGGAVDGQMISDAFLDPVSGTRVLAIGVLSASQTHSLFSSTDAGTTFGPALYQAAAGQTMTSVEIARSDPNVIYLAMRTSDYAPLLARSSDGGAHFTVKELFADLGKGTLRIIAIDPQDPDRVLFRFLAENDQSVVLTVDGGTTARKALTVNGDFTSYVRLPNGTILVGGLVDSATRPGLFRSRDQGTTFEQIPSPPSIRALSQRNGLVYAATNNFGDGYALGTSADEGTTWRAMMSYADVKAIAPCLKSQCQTTCDVEVSLSLWPAEVCAADPPAPTGAGGAGGAAGRGGNTGGAGAGGALGGGGTMGGAGGRPPPPKGGGCAAAGADAAAPWGLSLVLLSFAIGVRRRTFR